MKRGSGSARKGTAVMMNHEVCLPEGFSLWCRIEDLGSLCGFDPERHFEQLREIAYAYPARPGQDPEDYAEEHPMQALACLVRRFLAEYPDAADAAAVAAPVKERGKAA